MAKANELKDASAAFISFVKKGANGEPLRVLKEDVSGLTAALSSVSKSGDAGGHPVFFSAKTEEAAGALEEVLVAQGFKTDNVLDTEHGTVFMQAGAVPADVIMVELEPGVHMAVGGLPIKKADLYGCSGEEATQFENVMGTEGAVPMVNTVMDALRTSVCASLRVAKTSADARQSVAGALRGAANYLDGIIGMIPITAFKIEQEMAELPFEPEAEGDDKPAEPAVAAKTDPAADADDKKDEPKTEPATAAKTGEGDKKDEPKPAADEPAADTVQKGAGAADPDAIAAAVLKSVTGLLAPIQESLKAVAERVDKQDIALHGKVIGGSHGDEATRTKKGDQPRSGSDDFSFDTGNGRRP